MEVKVCDALCGAGKTMSCINMMNHDTEHKFIFITPYLTEVERIKRSCSGRQFMSPEKSPLNKFSKLRSLHDLMERGENIVSTHALFSTYTEETQQLIRANNYILVLDEVIDLFQPVGFDGGDINFLVRNNIAKKGEDGNIVWDDEEYTGVVFSDLMRMSQSNNLVDYDGAFYFWAIPIEIFNCFNSAYILTYLFEHQLLKHFFDVNHISYELIGTKLHDGEYSFCPMQEMDRRTDLKSLVHVCQNQHYNEIGTEAFSLSGGWFERAAAQPGKPKLVTLKNNVYNFFRSVKAGNDDKMWTTLNKYRGYLKGKGYSNAFITFNKRATNDYANRHCLAFCLNVFMQPWARNYLMKIGAEEINQDMYALSVLVQWLFRSGIRNGEEVWLYLPSRRMRYLLECWLDNLADGRDLDVIKFAGKTPPKIKEGALALYNSNTRKGGNA